MRNLHPIGFPTTGGKIRAASRVFVWFAGICLALFVIAHRSFAEDIALNLSVEATQEGTVTVTIDNVGSERAFNPQLEIGIPGNSYQHQIPNSLNPGETTRTVFKIQPPTTPGTYALVTTLRYSAGEVRLSAQNVTEYRIGVMPPEALAVPSARPDTKSSLEEKKLPPAAKAKKNDKKPDPSVGEKVGALENATLAPPTQLQSRVIEATCPPAEIHIGSAGRLVVPHAKDAQTRLILPDEVTGQLIRTNSAENVYLLRSTQPYRRSSAAAFVLFESPGGVSADGGAPLVAGLKRCSIRINTSAVLLPEPIFIFPYYYHLLIAGLGFVASVLLYRSASRGVLSTFNSWTIALIRWTFSFALVTLLFFLYEGARELSAYLIWRIPGLAISIGGERGLFLLGLMPTAEWLSFSNGDYQNFNRYVAEPFYLYMLTLNLLVIRFLIRPDPAREKYWHLMLKVFRLIPGLRNSAGPGGVVPRRYDRRLAHIAILALLVKCFYIPIFSSWSIGNVFHMQYLAENFSTNYMMLCRSFIDVLILVDVFIFTVGYYVELPVLKNEIKSVEPTFLGWFVCLICYPPFNRWALTPLDQPVFGVVANCGALCAPIVVTMTALLWFIYVWASVALGFKASNLTNRGIISHGPYRYVRHPAYISKLTIWLLASLFLGTMNVLFVVVLFGIYSLRAWTEERHLSSDPDYGEYRKRVPWAYIPGVF